MSKERDGHTLQATELVNEAFMKLFDGAELNLADRSHFFNLAARQMRRILVDHSRRRRSAKRGGIALQVPLDEVLLEVEACGIDVIALDDALQLLAQVDERKSRLVELRYFGGLSLDETADVLGVSPETVKRDWKMARAWSPPRWPTRSTSS